MVALSNALAAISRENRTPQAGQTLYVFALPDRWQ